MAAPVRRRRVLPLVLRAVLLMIMAALLANNAFLRRQLDRRRSSDAVRSEVKAASAVHLSSKVEQTALPIPTARSMPERRHIPHILHQSWKNTHVPARFLEWQASWKRLHPHWQFRLWSDSDNRQLLIDHYPWFLRTFDALPKPIMQADAIRPFYMHRYGGVYADLDVEALRNIDSLLGGEEPVLAFMSSTWWLRHNIPNAWMASPPGHPFWQHCWAHTMLALQPQLLAGQYDIGDVEGVTGPVALMESLEEYVASTGKNVTVLPPGQIFAYDWHKVTYCREPWCIERVQQCSATEATFDPTLCKAHYPEAYAITYWAHSWGDDTAEQKNQSSKLKDIATTQPATRSEAVSVVQATLGAGGTGRVDKSLTAAQAANLAAARANEVVSK